jgi:hypothetical protein
MRRILAITFTTGLIAIGFLLPAGTGAASSSGSPNAWSAARPITRQVFVGGTRVVASASFDSATHVEFLTAEVSGGSRLVVDTKDCCLKGDHWLVTLVNTSGGATVGAPDAATATCGSGSTRRYSGAAGMDIRRGTVKVLIAYCSGVDVFDAGMDIRLRYDGSMDVSA